MKIRIKELREQKKISQKKLCDDLGYNPTTYNNYEECVTNFQSVIRKPASQEQYEKMLAYVQTEIAKLTKKKHPNDALNKLMSARHIFEKQNNEQSLKYIDMLINEIRNGQQLRINKA